MCSLYFTWIQEAINTIPKNDAPVYTLGSRLSDQTWGEAQRSHNSWHVGAEWCIEGCSCLWRPSMDLCKKAGTNNLGRERKEKVKEREGRGRCFCMFLLPLKWMLFKSRVCGFAFHQALFGTMTVWVPIPSCAAGAGLTVTRMADPEEQKHSRTGLCVASLLAVTIVPPHTWHTRHTWTLTSALLCILWKW